MFVVKKMNQQECDQKKNRVIDGGWTEGKEERHEEKNRMRVKLKREKKIFRIGTIKTTKKS